LTCSSWASHKWCSYWSNSVPSLQEIRSESLLISSWWSR
jgi:hypothetical protein